MKKYFLTGLVILLPAAVTIVVILFVVNFFTEPFIGLSSSIIYKYNFFSNGFLFLSQEQLIQYSSRILILLFLFLATVVLGIFTRWFFINAIFKLCDKVLHRIPLINTVYKTSQDIIKTIFVSDKNSFKQVVMVPFPRPGIYVLGLIARESPSCCSEKIGEELTSVLVPTTPNPTTGFLLMFKKEDILHVDMKPEDAIKYIVSCGVILPGEKHQSPVSP